MELIIGIMLLVIGVVAATGFVEDYGKYGGVHIEAREEEVLTGWRMAPYLLMLAVFILGGTTLVGGWFQPPT